MKSPAFLTLVASILLIPADSTVAQPSGRRGGFGGPTGPRIEPKDLEFSYGVDHVPNRELFDKLSYKGTDVGRDPYLANIQYVKFVIEGLSSENERVYIMNTGNYRAHPPYMRMVGIGNQGVVRGAVSYMPRLRAPDGEPGLYVLDFQPNDSYSFEEIKSIRKSLVAKMPILKGKVAFHPLRGNLSRYESEKEKYAASDLKVYLDGDLYSDIAFLPLNSASSFGRLRVMDNEARPSPRDIVICRTLPNQMPRVAGVISEERQTPLSHVNLRAVQDRIPNAYISGAVKQKNIASLIGKLVHYEVTTQGFTIREASQAEVDRYFDSQRPKKAQLPVRDLNVKTIQPLSAVKFEHSASVGVKAANLAAMQDFKLPSGTVPDGFAVPFYFYDEFMKHNGFYKAVDLLLQDSKFQADRETQISKLKELRVQIKQGSMPEWMTEALTKVHGSFPDGTSIRCRSSTNNEDLPGFSGAGLYDSCTHHPNEGHLSKSIKQVFASLWNFRAFEEREFYRIDHKLAAMGVLLHPNFKGEKANGVAVTDDILYETQANYYVNTQIGEDLVTNPDEASSPEELLLAWYKEDGDQIVRRSAQASDSGRLLSATHADELRKRLAQIHGRFARLYGFGEDDKFAMEIEFKITSEGNLVIKQARPWVY